MTESGAMVTDDPQPPYRILLAEDDLTNQFVAKAMLEKKGFHVTCANNGLEACTLLENRPYDLVLMDVSMPEMDGIEATQVIRETLFEKAALPIIGMTAHNLTEVRESCLNAGMNDFIAKPASGGELTNKIKSWL